MGPGYGRRSAKSAPLPRVVGDDREAFCRLVLIESAESGFRVVATRLPIAGRDWKTPFSTPDGDRRARASVRADERSDPRRARTVIARRCGWRRLALAASAVLVPLTALVAPAQAATAATVPGPSGWNIVTSPSSGEPDDIVLGSTCANAVECWTVGTTVTGL